MVSGTVAGCEVLLADVLLFFAAGPSSGLLGVSILGVEDVGRSDRRELRVFVWGVAAMPDGVPAEN